MKMKTFNFLILTHTSLSEHDTKKSAKAMGNKSKMVFQDDLKMAK